MKKIIGALLGLILLFVTASSALAWSGCLPPEIIERPGYAFTKIVCRNPEKPVQAKAVARSPDGKATAIAIGIVITDGNATVNNTAMAIANTGGNSPD